MTFTTDALARYPDASPAVRKKLADAIAAAQASQDAASPAATDNDERTKP
jgi:hypothetical protein